MILYFHSLSICLQLIPLDSVNDPGIFSCAAFIVMDKTSDRPKSKGFGFVTFVDMGAADDCVAGLNGKVSIQDLGFLTS